MSQYFQILKITKFPLSKKDRINFIRSYFEYENALISLIRRIDEDKDKHLNKEELHNLYPGLDESGINMVLLMADDNADNKLSIEELRNHLPDLESINAVLDSMKVYILRSNIFICFFLMFLLLCFWDSI